MDKTAMMARMAQAAAQRGGVGGASLLHDADMNIGNAVIVSAENRIITQPITNPPRITNLNGESTGATMTTVGIAARAEIPDSSYNGFAPGPLTALIEYGNGGVSTLVEVDVPVGRMASLSLPYNPSSAMDGGIIASVPAGTLRVYGRHDGNLITPSISGNFGGPSSVAGSQNLPVGAGSWSAGAQIGPLPASMKAFATYDPWALTRRNTKTTWVYNNSTVAVTVPASTLYWVPALARAVQVLRNTAISATAPTNITLTFYMAQNNELPFIIEQYTIAAGTNCPIIQLPGGVIAVGVQTSADINFLALVFDIAV